MTQPDDGLRDLIATHQVAVRRYAARRVPACDVDDVVAEVFVVAWRHRDRLTSEVELWLLRAAHNTIAHRYRAEQRRVRMSRRLRDYHDRDRLGLDPADAFSATDAGHALTDALRQLSELDQEILRLTYWEQLSTAEVAFVLRCSSSAARVRVHRARRRLVAVLPEWLRPIATSPRPSALPLSTYTDKEMICDA